jgi:hypothetical protein
MSDNRYRSRDKTANNVRSQNKASPRSSDESFRLQREGNPAKPKVLAALAITAIAALGAALWSYFGAAELPMPSDQNAGPEYRTETLKLQPAPTVSMPIEHKTLTSCAASVQGQSLSNLDLVIAIDTTGSMGGVINDVKANVAQLVASLRSGGGSVRIGLVAYRDKIDEYVTRAFPLTPLDEAGIASLNAYIASLQVGGGGDWPEAVDQALYTAAGMSWRGNVPSSIIVVGDAPAHPEQQQTAFAIGQAFSSKIPGGQVSVIDTGSGANAFMKALPEQGGGQYVTYDGHILNSLLPAITACPSQ